MSISTRTGDGGSTSLPGGKRVSKADSRVECYGAIDELVSQIGFARSITADAEVSGWLEAIQRDLFKVGSAIGAGSGEPEHALSPEMTAILDEHVRRVEAIEGMLKDWALPGALPAAAALDIARTVCRRAERQAVQLTESGTLSNSLVLAYLNRLSDVLWLFARLLELRAEADGALRDRKNPGRPWSRAW